VWGQTTRFRHDHVTKSGIVLCWVVESTGGSVCFMYFLWLGDCLHVRDSWLVGRAISQWRHC
jgi:lipid-A-disaccharide synthase-like uncharacterized protein